MPKVIVSRCLSVNDIPCLVKLEQRQWDMHQAASASALRQRINNHPGLCVGRFCVRSGDVWASLFMRAVSGRAIQKARSTTESALGRTDDPVTARGHSLFGINLTWRAAAAPRPGGRVAPAVVTVAHGPAARPVEGAGTGMQGVNP